MRRLGIMFILIVLFHFWTKAQSADSVLSYCSQIGIKHPDIVTDQSILETGLYNCKDCSLDHNNLFGFRYKKKYLTFETWQQSCDYYLKWQTKHYKGQDYFDFLNCIWKHQDGKCARYATDEDYTNKLKHL